MRQVFLPFFADIAPVIVDKENAIVLWRSWRAHYLHPCLFRSPPSFSPIARDTGCNDVVPGMGSASIARYHVIQGKLLGFLATVLTGILITAEYLHPGELTI